MLALSLAVLAGSLAFTTAEVCNPSTLPSSDWITANYATVNFSPTDGAMFTFNKRYDAPYIWTDKYLMFGRVDVKLRAAPGAGLITGSVLMSDNQDELDWEWSGNNFGKGEGKVQTNYFGKGITGHYDRGAEINVNDPHGKFYTYSYDWKPEQVEWLIDGRVVRTLKNTGAGGDYQYPQSPSRLHLGIWNAGDPDTPQATSDWAGGKLNMTGGPYTAYIQSVKITPYKPCSSYKFPEKFSGKWEDVQCTNQTLGRNATISSGDTYEDLNITTSTANQTGSASKASSTHTVKSGDTCDSISRSLGCLLDDLKKANQGVNCDFLIIGSQLNVPGKGGSTSASSTSSTSSSVVSSSTNSAVSTTTTVTNTVTNTVTVTAVVSSGSNSICSPTATVTVTAAAAAAAALAHLQALPTLSRVDQ
ncbi:60S ribosomal protein L37 [Lithohypha guttulata]|uniref:60S ribosomal protein L37 n=1 Tax=Lithohypha guttulata TaxID=1690604 RepID=UPI002DE15B9F|nr:60S ribosomal protein L37 [Lithohypha guttulata]